jgi:putative membrane protein
MRNTTHAHRFVSSSLIGESVDYCSVRLLALKRSRAGMTIALAASSSNPEESSMKTKCVLTVVALSWTAAAFAAGSSADTEFAKKAAQGSMAEVEAGKLAVSNGQSAEVKKFGQRMVDDHSKANEDLKAAAAKQNIDLPTSVSPKQKQDADKLAKLKGAEFDKEYSSMMLKDHEKDVAEFKKEAASGSDPAIKAFAQKTLPTLEMHLKMAQEMDQSHSGAMKSRSQ